MYQTDPCECHAYFSRSHVVLVLFKTKHKNPYTSLSHLAALIAHPLPPSSLIFRPFVGYKEVRLVSKESRHVSYLFVSACLYFMHWWIHWWLICPAWGRAIGTFFCWLRKSSPCSHCHGCIARWAYFTLWFLWILGSCI